MREIKFRVWLKNSEVLTELIHLSFENKVLKVRHWENGESVWLEFDDVELLQYTGLKDKNGIEIYEGDIVECFNDGLSEVLFRKGSFGTLTYTPRGVDFYTFNEVYGTCEIIGNIYENPELLEREPQ